MRKFMMLLACASMLTACGGPSFVRGDEVSGLDKPAMSTGLDKKDLQKLFTANLKSLEESGAMSRWRTAQSRGEEATVAIFGIANETTEHIESSLGALLSKFETDLVNGGVVTVVSHERQESLLRELNVQQSDAFDPARAAQWGRQLGAQYFITGKIYDSAEKFDGERRVQYFLFMQCIEVETGAIRWQNEANLTKALIN